MGCERTHRKVFIIKKQGTRLSTEAVPTDGRSIPVLPASEVNLNPNLLPNTKIYGDAEERDSDVGPREWTGTLELEPGADLLGELLLSLLGKVTTDQPDVGGAPTVFRHKFVSHPTTDEHPLYTLFADRKTEAKKYGATAVNQMTFTFPVDGRVAVSADIMTLTEESGATLTPDFTADLESLLFSDVSIDIAGVTSSQIRQVSVQINHNQVVKRVLNVSRDGVNICAGPLEVTGGFQIFFENATERDKFIAGSVSDVLILVQGQVLEDVQKATLQIDMPRVKYDAAPFGDEDGAQVIDFTFRAVRDTSSGFQVEATLLNLETAY